MRNILEEHKQSLFLRQEKEGKGKLQFDKLKVQKGLGYSYHLKI